MVYKRSVNVSLLPVAGRAAVVVEAPGSGPGYWAGAPSALLVDGVIYLAYRLRRPIGAGRGYAVVVARSDDGEKFETVAVIEKDRLGAESLERPALVALGDGGWRLYVSCGTPRTLHWRVDALDAAHPADLPASRPRTVLAGNADTAYKDPVVVRRGDQWHLWVCCHAIADPAVADEMFTDYATSHDGLEWTSHGTALAGRPGYWDARGARVTSVLLDGPATLAYYDGRRNRGENWEEQTGLAVGSPERLQARGDAAHARSPHGRGGLRYLSVVPMPRGGHRLYYEATRPDGAHDLRTEYVPSPPSASQSS